MKAAAYIRYSIMGAKVRIFLELYYLLQYFSDIASKILHNLVGSMQTAEDSYQRKENFYLDLIVP